ncbi:MAG: hypothetical protein H7224_11105 [Polaromonas sp.]|nr:hypothetical protein [Polaromonas sp.]
MNFIGFNKTTEPLALEDLRVNPRAVLFVEASRPDLVGQTTIHLIGQGEMVNAVEETIGTVVSRLGGLVAARRHYLAAPPAAGPSTVYVAPLNVSYVRPNVPSAPDFWVVRFVDGSELRVLAPLPEGL